MRIIDADELRKTMYHEAFETDTDMQKWESGCWIRYKMFENVIENAPTIDAEPVRHGHWEKIGTIENTWVVHKCTYCGYQTIDNGQYCTNCGAKMDEVNDGFNR